MKKNLIAIFLSSTMLLSCSCGNKEDNEKEDRESLCQISLLQGLLQGDYNGSIPISELKKYGDTGIGTFDKLNGELIMKDGVVYCAKGDGTVEVPADNVTIPFSNVTFFDKDKTENADNISTFDEMVSLLNKTVSESSINRFCMVRIDGTFKTINVRSEYSQEKPYKPLVEVLEKDQTFYDYENIKGTVIALYCPDYMKELNNSGWHMHFISEDGKKGGHVLGLSTDKAEASYDFTERFNMLLPDNEIFNLTDFSKDRSEEVKKAEKNE